MYTVTMYTIALFLTMAVYHTAGFGSSAGGDRSGQSISNQCTAWRNSCDLQEEQLAADPTGGSNHGQYACATFPSQCDATCACEGSSKMQTCTCAPCIPDDPSGVQCNEMAYQCQRRVSQLAENNKPAWKFLRGNSYGTQNCRAFQGMAACCDAGNSYTSAWSFPIPGAGQDPCAPAQSQSRTVDALVNGVCTSTQQTRVRPCTNGRFDDYPAYDSFVACASCDPLTECCLDKQDWAQASIDDCVVRQTACGESYPNLTGAQARDECWANLNNGGTCNGDCRAGFMAICGYSCEFKSSD